MSKQIDIICIKTWGCKNVTLLKKYGGEYGHWIFYNEQYINVKCMDIDKILSEYPDIGCLSNSMTVGWKFTDDFGKVDVWAFWNFAGLSEDGLEFRYKD